MQPASVFGEIKYVFEDDDYVYASPNESMEKAKRMMDEFDPAKDYILYPNTGDPAAIYAVCMLIGFWFADVNIKFLYWDRELVEGEGRSSTKGSYKVIEMPLFN